MISKRGLSAIVATLLIILLTLVAVGIIWVAIRQVVQTGAENVATSAKCTTVDVSATGATCNSSSGNWTCNVTYKRASGGEAINGIRITISNALNSKNQDVAGDVAIGATRTEQNINTGLAGTDPKPTSVAVSAYFNDNAGNPQFCNPTAEFKNIG